MYSVFVVDGRLCLPLPTAVLCNQLGYAFQEFLNIHLKDGIFLSLLEDGTCAALSQKSKAVMWEESGWAMDASPALPEGTKEGILCLTWE